MIIGMLIAVSFTFILLLLEPQFPNYLRYGYLKKLFIWIWLLLIYLYAIKIEQQKFLLWNDKKLSILFYFISVISVLGLSFLAGASSLLLPMFRLTPEKLARLVNQAKQKQAPVKPQGIIAGAQQGAM